MAESDRSRSPVPGRNRADPGAAAQQVRPRVAVLSAMVWAHAISDLAIATYATASGSDLSFVLSSNCHSRDLMLEIHP